MISRSFGISLVVSSTRAGIARRPRIGPSTNPRNRSNEVHRPPAATWKNSSAKSLFAAIAATSATRTTPTIGSPLSGTISKSGRGGASSSAVGASRATSAMGASIDPPPPRGDMRHASGVEPNNAGELRTRDPGVAMAALAERQYGVVSRRQLVELGLGRHAIERLLKRARLHVVHRSVYAVGHRRLTRDGVRLAAVLAAGPGAVLSHRSAAALWCIRETARLPIELTAPREVQRPRLAVCRAVLPPDEVTVERGIPVTPPARPLLDLAALLDEHRLARAAERAEALRLASPTSLAELTARYPRRKGTPSVKRLIEEHRIVPTTTASDLERRFLTFLDANELPRPLVNESLDPFTPDFRWPNERLVVDLDGFETHGTRQAFERDRARDRQLTAQGWRVVRITKRQLEQTPDELADELDAMLRSATTAAPGPPPGPRTPAPRSRRAAR